MLSKADLKFSIRMDQVKDVLSKALEGTEPISEKYSLLQQAIMKLLNIAYIVAAGNFSNDPVLEEDIPETNNPILLWEKIVGQGKKNSRPLDEEVGKLIDAIDAGIYQQQPIEKLMELTNSVYKYFDHYMCSINTGKWPTLGSVVDNLPLSAHVMRR